ncbi:MAG TPA: flagellar protein [Phycisphaerales bacterium]|nr:flagellar protein [Phycisphaerales bacterium]HCD33514.1 flagellar protein [Phycisphaerales bacterium]|tara:strand:- start:1846 stop:2043 length:198 start_codon:yes stop_codon:yes gene_type:complete
MITLTRLNGKKFVLNAELIRTVESSPDTMVTLVNGDHFVVKEDMQDVIDAAILYGQTLRGLLPPS